MRPAAFRRMALLRGSTPGSRRRRRRPSRRRRRRSLVDEPSGQACAHVSVRRRDVEPAAVRGVTRPGSRPVHVFGEPGSNRAHRDRNQTTQSSFAKRGTPRVPRKEPALGQEDRGGAGQSYVFEPPLWPGIGPPDRLGARSPAVKRGLAGELPADCATASARRAPRVCTKPTGRPRGAREEPAAARRPRAPARRLGETKRCVGAPSNRGAVAAHDARAARPARSRARTPRRGRRASRPVAMEKATTFVRRRAPGFGRPSTMHARAPA